MTTEFPGLDALIREDGNDLEYGVRCAFGSDTWFGAAGGVALVGTFTDAADTPCFVFNSGGVQSMAGAASHEIGHTLGLMHRGGGSCSNGEYSYGIKVADEKYFSAPKDTVSADGYVKYYYEETYVGYYDWVPIMGATYYASYAIWTDGNYYNSESSLTGSDVGKGDLEILNRYIEYRTDDYASLKNGALDAASAAVGTLNISAADGTISTSGGQTLEAAKFSYSGIISDRNDTDVFVLNLTSEASIDIFVSGMETYSNLDVWAAIYSTSDLTTALLTSDPENSLNVELAGILNAGTYYLVVDGTGLMRTVSGYGAVEYYSDYASLGYYTVSGTVENRVTQLAAPTQFETQSRTTSSVTFSWNSIAHADRYNVYRADGTFLTSTTATTYTETGLNPRNVPFVLHHGGERLGAILNVGRIRCVYDVHAVSSGRFVPEFFEHYEQCSDRFVERV